MEQGGSILWSLIAQSDIMTKIIMLSLFGMSIVCWAIALYKMILLRIKKNQCDSLIAATKSVVHFSEFHEIAQDHKKTLPGYVLLQLLTLAKQARENGNADLLQVQSDMVVDDVMYHEESYTSVLSISASVATLLGLFGTVWGLIHAFVRISEKQSADIVAVAPGISEALITTIAGLFVAIPALIFSQYIMLRIRNLEYNLMTIADKVLIVTRMSMLRPAHKETADVSMPSVSEKSLY
ncbi:MotA/TolQ/ExbB proton channel family protein [Candidatus Babeliales bacterium]|nr:MotA/TolQ/ExbB proton channel family protein [Candidatus Babeliales bacterium]